MPVDHAKFILEAIKMGQVGMRSGEGGPFGAVIVRNGEIVGRGNNTVTSSNDPTAHAEVVAIRNSCVNLSTFQLIDCQLYTSCEPCPMCLGAIYWARLERVYYSCDKRDAAEAGFDDNFIYQELDLDMKHRSIPFLQIERAKALELFQEWMAKEDKIKY